MRIVLYLCFGLLFSCASGPVDPVEDEGLNDSLSEVIDSPELKKINQGILADASNDSLYKIRALLYLKLNQPDAAVNDAKRAIRIDSLDPGNYLTLVDIYFAQNKTRQAKDLLLITEKKFPQNTEALLKLAELYWLVRQYQNGIDYVNKALRINESLARGYYIKGGIYRESGDTARAVSSLVTATEQNNRYTDAFYDLGIIYGARKNPIAFQYFDNVLRIDPGHKETMYARAKLFQDLGRIDESIAAYKQVLDKHSDCAQCSYNLGAIMLEIKKDYDGALGHFSDAIRQEPDNPHHYFARGYTYSKMGEFESARADYRTCLKIDPAHDAAAEGLNELERK